MGNSTSLGLEDVPQNKTFNKKNSTSGLKLSNKHNTISQKDHKIRSILGTQIVTTNQTFYWNFSIENWSGRCCRFGIINPEVKAKGSIWSTSGSICICISNGCWSRVWGASSKKISTTQLRKNRKSTPLNSTHTW
eukprot:353787_1